MANILKSVSSLCSFRLDDDWFDRLCRLITVLILFAFASIIGIKQFFGQPMDCWCPSEFTDSHRAYANSICWTSRTHFLPMESVIPGVDTPSQGARYSFFKWAPAILIIQAFITFIPCFLWRLANRLSGIDVSGIMNTARHYSEAHYPEIKEKARQNIVNEMDRYLRAQSEPRTICCYLSGRMYGNYLTCVYMFIKLSYISNIITQLILLEKIVLGARVYGLRIIFDLLTGQVTHFLNLFPLITLCDYEIRHQSRLHKYVIQCTLPINALTGSFFGFLWFWLIFLVIAMIISSGYWFCRMLYGPGNVQFIREQLSTRDIRDTGAINKFTNTYLRRDGVFILHLMSANIGEPVVNDVIFGLWNNYMQKQLEFQEQKIGVEVRSQCEPT